MLGTSSFLLVLGVAAAKKWVHLPAWGWEQTSFSQVVRWLLLLAVGQFAVAWNEEVVMRGYGLHSLSVVVGKPAAAIGLTTLDAWAHGPGLRIFVGQGMVGLVLMILRLRTGALWMPIGYHFAWNYMQTAIFGPPNTYPSLRPLHVTGPSSWLGQPGSPEPGILSTLVHIGLAVVSVWTWWRRHSKQ
jgi:membrane protease YdiL (CAAX protease family)